MELEDTVGRLGGQGGACSGAFSVKVAVWADCLLPNRVRLPVVPKSEGGPRRGLVRCFNEGWEGDWAAHRDAGNRGPNSAPMRAFFPVRKPFHLRGLNPPPTPP